MTGNHISCVRGATPDDLRLDVEDAINQGVLLSPSRVEWVRLDVADKRGARQSLDGLLRPLDHHGIDERDHVEHAELCRGRRPLGGRDILYPDDVARWLRCDGRRRPNLREEPEEYSRSSKLLHFFLLFFGWLDPVSTFLRRPPRRREFLLVFVCSGCPSCSLNTQKRQRYVWHFD